MAPKSLAKDSLKDGPRDQLKDNINLKSKLHSKLRALKTSRTNSERVPRTIVKSADQAQRIQNIKNSFTLEQQETFKTIGSEMLSSMSKEQKDALLTNQNLSTVETILSNHKSKKKIKKTATQFPVVDKVVIPVTGKPRNISVI